MLGEVISCKKERTTAMKKGTMSNFYHHYYNPINFMQPISHSTYNSNPAAVSTPIPTSNEQNLREEKQEDPRGKRDKWISAQTHWLVAMVKEKIQGIESGKPRVIYAKIIAKADTLGNPKTTKQIREKLRNLKYSYKKTKENNRKSGSAHEFPSFYHDFDEVLSDRAVVKLPEVKQIACQRSSSNCGESGRSEKVLNFHFQK